MKVEVMRYRKADGYATRYWAVHLNGELLAVTVYRKGARAIAEALTTTHHHHAAIIEDKTEAAESYGTASARVATYRAG